MTLLTFIASGRALVLGLALISSGPVWAQTTTSKTKVKKTRIAGPTVAKTKTTTTSPVSGAPQPASPAASAPQAVVASPAPGGTATEAPAGWLSDLSAAQAQAKATNRPIVAVFSGSDWCKPCIMYDKEVFAQPEFAAYAKDRLVLAHFDFPRQAKNQPPAAQIKLNEAAAAQINHEGDFPLAVIVSPDGKVLAKTGYIAGGPAAFEAYLKKVLPTL